MGKGRLMNEKRDPKGEILEIRERAEVAAAKNRLAISDVSALSPEKVQQLIHELQVHQIELEMQNDELRRAQLQLEESRDRFVDLYDYAPIGYFTLDGNSLILEVNLAGANLLGMERESLIGKPLTSFADKDSRDTFYFHRNQVLETATRHICEIKLVKPDDGWFHAQLESIGIADSEGKFSGLRTAISDITDRKLAGEALKKAHDEFERLNDLYRETIHFISHENKNSLIVIAGFVRRLLETEADPARRDELAIVCHHSQFLEAMSRDFLVMADLEHGEFHVKKTLIRNFYEDVVLPAMIGLKERYPDSFKSYDESMGGVGAIQLMGDPSLMEVVYRNLFGNALKYRHPHGKIAYGVVERTDCYLFNVWNEGPGVPPDQLESIFEKFYRVRNDATGEKPGTGLGLHTIRRIIEAHGGRIWCETSSGDWINFLFILPKE